jgi:hypothetical protein
MFGFFQCCGSVKFGTDPDPRIRTTDPDPALFVNGLQYANKKQFFFQVFFAYYRTF